LPGTNIEIKDLTIIKKVTLLGSPGSSLILKGGSIIIKNEGELHISETTIVSHTSKPVFEIIGNSKLSLIDCALTGSSDSDGVCIHLYSNNESSAGCVKVIASCFYMFFTHILCGKNASVDIENCNFSESKNSSILAINPLSLKVKNSEFKNCIQSSIEIRYILADYKGNSSEVNIIGNTINNSKANGILICSDNTTDSPLEFINLTIERNEISKVTQEGIAINSIKFYKAITVSMNEISYCNNNGIYITSSYSLIPHNPPEIALKGNTIKECKAAGIFAFNSTCTITKSRITRNWCCGVIMANMRYIGNINYCSIKILKSTISNNIGNGIQIVDSKDCNILFDSNIIENNSKTGVIINLTEEKNLTLSAADSEMLTKLSKRKCNKIGNIWIKNGSVSHNESNGLEIFHGQLFLNSMNIKGNADCALKLYGNYKNVQYSDEIKRKKTITGYVMSNNKKVHIYHSSSSCTICAII